jgi:hypothetical protein
MVLSLAFWFFFSLFCCSVLATTKTDDTCRESTLTASPVAELSQLKEADLVQIYAQANSHNATSSDISRLELLFLYHRSIGEVSSAEFRDVLGARLNSQAHLLQKYHHAIEDSGSLTPTWVFFRAELLRHELDPVESALFFNYRDFHWHPELFGWSELGTVYDSKCVMVLSADERVFFDRWLPVLLSGNRYGHYLPTQISISIPIHEGIRIQPLSVRAERVEHVFQHYVLQICTGGKGPTDFTQIVEVGGGTGDHAVVLRELKFSGQHIIFDLPEVLLVQQYFLSLAGWPVISMLERELDALHNAGEAVSVVPLTESSTLLVHNIGQLTFQLQQVHGQKVVMEASNDDDGGGNINADDTYTAQRSLLWATFSLGEAPISLRSRIMDQTLRFDTIFLTFFAHFGEVDNVQWMRQWALDHKKSYRTCIWLTRNGEVENTPFYYFVARKVGLGDLHCAPEVGCSAENVITCDDSILSSAEESVKT